MCIHPIITIDGDTAKGNWMLYMMYFYRPHGPVDVLGAGPLRHGLCARERTLEDRRDALERDSSVCRAAARRPGSGEPADCRAGPASQ